MPVQTSTSRYEDVISGRKRGLAGYLARAGLRALSFSYERGIRFRNAYYDTWAMPVWLDIPVVSVGNLTVGGTGKTPMVIWLCERILERGRKPAVLSRGYKATPHSGPDELLLISRRVPEAIAVAHPDRVQAGRYAIAEHQAQVAILDDGFQHRRLGRDLDLLLIDATRPFGHGHILPRGLLREPISSVRRADAVVMTRCDQAPADQIEAAEKKIRGWAGRVPIVRAVHCLKGFADLSGRPVERPSAVSVACVAGIARPEAFLRTLSAAGFAPEDCAWFPDHYAYLSADADALIAWARERQIDCLLTTEKDAVKLDRLPGADWPIPVVAVRVGMELLGDGQAVLGELIDRMLAEHEDQPKTEATEETHGQESKANPPQ